MKIKSEMDEMTGVYNKTTTELVMNEILTNSVTHQHVMLVIDIDNFKSVNDLSGHQMGDHVIKVIANLISKMFRKSDIVGRIGGDEFIVLMVDVPSMDIVYTKLNELIQLMRYKPDMTIPEYVTLSIGMASNGQGATTYQALFEKADAALYQAKEGGKAQYREYGVEPINLNGDKRPAVLLLSENRSVCSTINALIPASLRVIEALKLEDVEKLKTEDQNNMVMIFADVSDNPGDGEEIWQSLQKLPWLEMDQVFAICAEGNIPQYRVALGSGVADMFTTPLDSAAFKRRTEKHLEKVGVLEEKTNA
ncbi:MAG: diguanylate cyclase [Lachnospiraceae bacterium]|nr:diguanylate cyclase [Lachnospiraceae bacterium]